MPILETAESLLVAANGLVEGVNVMKSEITLYGQEQYTKGWDEAMAQAGTGGSTDKIYSEAEMNAIILEEKAKVEAVYQPMIVERDAQITALNEQGQANIDKAVADLKAQVAADFESTQVDDNAFLAKYKA